MHAAASTKTSALKLLIADYSWAEKIWRRAASKTFIGRSTAADSRRHISDEQKQEARGELKSASLARQRATQKKRRFSERTRIVCFAAMRNGGDDDDGGGGGGEGGGGKDDDDERRVPLARDFIREN